MLIALYKSKSKLQNFDDIYLAVSHPEQLSSANIKPMTIAVNVVETD